MSNHDGAVIVKDLYKSFKLPHEQHNGLKQLVVNFTKRKKGYEVQHVLEDVSFEIKKGEFFGIVGRNGSGKSTLLKLLAGIYTPDKGLVHVEGSLTPFIELGVGFNPELTGRENIFMNGALLGFSRKEMGIMYNDIVKFAELSRFMDQKLKNYSSGMQVRLAFSIAIRARSDILLIDEVLAVGDTAFQQKCFDYFEKLKKEGRTIILVTHDMSAVKRFCTSALYLSDGEVVKIGSPLEISQLYDEANIDGSQQDNNELPASKSTLKAKLSQRETGVYSVDFEYNIEKGESAYIGTSVIWNGISIAEITTPPQKRLRLKGKVSYLIHTDELNAGSYQFTAALFRSKNRELMAVNKNKLVFSVDGFDITKGGALKLRDTWKYE